MEDKKGKKQVKISFNVALAFILLFSCVMLSLAIYVQVLKSSINEKYDTLSEDLQARKRYSIITEYK